MKSICASVVVLAVATLVSQSAAHEWKCKGEKATFSEKMMGIFSKCHSEAGDEDNVDKMDKIYHTKCCVWRDPEINVVQDGKINFDKMKEMFHSVFPNGVGDQLIDAVKKGCEDKLADANFAAKNDSGKPFFKCMMQTIHKECQ